MYRRPFNSVQKYRLRYFSADLVNEYFERFRRHVRENVMDATMALLNQQYHRASELYRNGLAQLTELSCCTDRETIAVKYAYGIACIETKIHEDMIKSIAVFEDILKNYPCIPFPLAHYGLALSYFKQNRFREALEAAKNGLEAIDLGEIDEWTWPLASECIPESLPGRLKVVLEGLLESCRNPPRPNAVCRYDKCSEMHWKSEIYLTDPDCKGYIKILCMEDCCLHYHPNCWKNLKEELDQTNDKDFLNSSCLTPDCPSTIVELIHIDSQGDEAKKFHHLTGDKIQASGIKQKKTKLEKKLILKEKKRKKKSESEGTLKDDVAVLSSNEKEEEVETTNSETKKETVEVQPIKPTQAHHETHPFHSIPVNSNVNSENFSILKRDDNLTSRETVRKCEKNKEKRKEKRKQSVTLDEFFGYDQNSSKYMSKDYATRLAKLRAHKHNVESGIYAAAAAQSAVSAQSAALWNFHGVDDFNSKMDQIEEYPNWSTGEEDDTFRDQLMTQSISDSLVLYMKNFLLSYGSVCAENPELVHELAMLPVEIQEIITTMGGIVVFLNQFEDFKIIDGNVISLADSTTEFVEINDFEAELPEETPIPGPSKLACASSAEAADVGTIDGPINPPRYETPCSSGDDASQVQSTDSGDPVDQNSYDQTEEKVVEKLTTKSESVNVSDATDLPSQRPRVLVDLERHAHSRDSQHYRKLQKLWKFVTKFSESGQASLLCLVLETIINEKILEQFSPPGDNVQKTVTSFKFAIEALKNCVHRETQTDRMNEQPTQVEVDYLRKMVLAEKLANKNLKDLNAKLTKVEKEREELIAYLLSEQKERKWLEEKKALEMRISTLTKSLQETEIMKKRLADELNQEQQKAVTNARLTRSASATRPKPVATPEVRCSSASQSNEVKVPAATRWQPQFTTLSSGKPIVVPVASTSTCGQIRSGDIISKMQGTTNEMPHMKNSYEKLMAMLASKFPLVSREELKLHVQVLRNRSSGKLTGMTMEQIVQEVSKMVANELQRLQCGQFKTSAFHSAGGGLPQMAASWKTSKTSMGLDRIAEPGGAWQMISHEQRNWKTDENDDDPCIICHEELRAREEIVTLQCQHKFHRQCIKQWFQQQSTCPTCRLHSLLPDEFPAL